MSTQENCIFHQLSEFVVYPQNLIQIPVHICKHFIKLLCTLDAIPVSAKIISIYTGNVLLKLRKLTQDTGTNVLWRAG